MTRIYLAASAGDLELLAAGKPVSVVAFGATGDLETAMDGDGNLEDVEFAALSLASDASQKMGTHRIVIAADVDESDVATGGELGELVLSAPVGLDQVASFHLGLEGDEDLAWYATQELGGVLTAIGSTAPHPD